MPECQQRGQTKEEQTQLRETGVQPGGRGESGCAGAGPSDTLPQYTLSLPCQHGAGAWAGSPVTWPGPGVWVCSPARAGAVGAHQLDSVLVSGPRGRRDTLRVPYQLGHAPEQHRTPGGVSPYDAGRRKAPWGAGEGVGNPVMAHGGSKCGAEQGGGQAEGTLVGGWPRALSSCWQG